MRVADLDRGTTALNQAGIEAVREGAFIRVNMPAGEAGKVTRVLAERGLYLTELRPEEVSLETVFLELTGDAGRPRP